MSEVAVLDDVTETSAPDWVRTAYEGLFAQLTELSETGMAIARTNARLTEDARSVESLGIAADTHARIARTVRLTVLLQSRILKAIQAHEKGVIVGVSSAHKAKSRVKQIVSDIVMRVCDDTDRAEDVLEEVAERLDRDDIYGEVLSKPFSELVASICNDVGVDLHWSVIAEEDWAKAEIASGKVGWPLARVSPERPQGCSIFPFKHEGHEEGAKDAKFKPILNLPPSPS